jgi:hypothetical protein
MSRLIWVEVTPHILTSRIEAGVVAVVDPERGNAVSTIGIGW